MLVVTTFQTQKLVKIVAYVDIEVIKSNEASCFDVNWYFKFAGL